jgi:hypothetical protein
MSGYKRQKIFNIRREMGQQQLLIIVLVFILVGAAIITGINIYTATADQANKEAVITDLMNLTSIARSYYYRPAALGGGGNSFANFKIPGALAETENGTIIQHTKTGHNPDHLHFEATGKGTGIDGSPIIIEARITINDMVIKEISVTSTAKTTDGSKKGK